MRDEKSAFLATGIVRSVQMDPESLISFVVLDDVLEFC